MWRCHVCQVCTPQKVNVYNMCGDSFMYSCTTYGIRVLLGYLTSTYMICVVMVLCTPCGCYLDGGDGTCCELYVLTTVYHLTLEVEVKIHLGKRCLMAFFDRLTFTLSINASIHQNCARMKCFRSLNMELYPNCCRSLTL